MFDYQFIERMLTQLQMLEALQYHHETVENKEQADKLQEVITEYQNWFIDTAYERVKYMKRLEREYEEEND